MPTIGMLALEAEELRKPGRPRKDAQEVDSRQMLIDAAVAIIAEGGAEAVTVRAVCERAGLSNGTFYHHFKDKDGLMAHFVGDALFGEPVITHPADDVVGVITDLYLHLVRGYVAQGLGFMKKFYSTGNRALSAYMGEKDGAFPPGTVMARSEAAFREAQALGGALPGADAHRACADVCTVVKGCMFEWCLSDGALDVEAALSRLIASTLAPYLA